MVHAGQPAVDERRPRSPDKFGHRELHGVAGRRGGWQPVSADAIQVARSVGWQFRIWPLWDQLQGGSGPDRGSLDSAAAQASFASTAARSVGGAAAAAVGGGPGTVFLKELEWRKLVEQ
jgi:hypothetical protein